MAHVETTGLYPARDTTDELAVVTMQIDVVGELIDIAAPQTLFEQRSKLSPLTIERLTDIGDETVAGHRSDKVSLRKDHGRRRAGQS